MKIIAKTRAPERIPTGEKSTPTAALMKTETTAMKATKMKSVMITVEYMVPLSCPKFANVYQASSFRLRGEIETIKH